MATITISKSNFYHNLNQIALKVGSKEKIAVVLKDNAYGHGLGIIAELASEYGILHAVVRNLAEAREIEGLFESILILGSREYEVNEKFNFAVNSLEEIPKIPRGCRVELKNDTGMHRNGIACEQIGEALELIEKHGLVLSGAFTHYRSADVLSSELFWQQKNFEKVKEKLRSSGFDHIRFHGCNSAAALRACRSDEAIVRAGIGIYGYNELPFPFDDTMLKPVLALYASRVATRVLRKGQRVGYGGDLTAPHDMTIATYDLGYGDGWCRGDSMRPYTTAEGLPILGRVSMDLISLESDKEQVCIMDDAKAAAKHFGTISYEMTTALSPFIKRIVVE